MKKRQPTALICTRLADMTVMHPLQVERKCNDCGHIVGVYPSGQKAINKDRKMKIKCSVCAGLTPAQMIKGLNVKMAPAADMDTIIKEMRDSKPVGRA